MKLIVGLGNPGKSYAGNRHNIGFMAIDRMIDDYALSRPSNKFGGLLSDGAVLTQKILAFKPMGYMNTSGGPVGEVSRFYKIPPEDIIVIHDELDLTMGRMRVKQGGGNGGHNGLKSIDSHIGKDYWRIRLGIGHPGNKNMVSSYVLSDFNKDEQDDAQMMVDEISRHIDLLLKGDDTGFMNKVSLHTHSV